jgi:hypothetical protein
MAAPSLDSEFMQYWLKLTMPEKQSLLSVAKTYVHLKEETYPVSIEQYNLELAEAMTRVDKGEFFTQDQVVEMSKTWLHGK